MQSFFHSRTDFAILLGSSTRIGNFQLPDVFNLFRATKPVKNIQRILLQILCGHVRRQAAFNFFLHVKTVVKIFTNQLASFQVERVRGNVRSEVGQVIIALVIFVIFPHDTQFCVDECLANFFGIESMVGAFLSKALLQNILEVFQREIFFAKQQVQVIRCLFLFLHARQRRFYFFGAVVNVVIPEIVQLVDVACEDVTFAEAFVFISQTTCAADKIFVLLVGQRHGSAQSARLCVIQNHDVDGHVHADCKSLGCDDQSERIFVVAEKFFDEFAQRSRQRCVVKGNAPRQKFFAQRIRVIVTVEFINFFHLVRHFLNRQPARTFPCNKFRHSLCLAATVDINQNFCFGVFVVNFFQQLFEERVLFVDLFVSAHHCGDFHLADRVRIRC